MKILIFGKGFFGSRLAELWPEAVLSDARINKMEDVLQEIERVKPDAVINATGVTGKPNVDWCETHQTETAHGNVTVPLMIAEACKAKSVYMVHLGSGYIFGGTSPDPKGWNETDPTSPLAYYSRTKYAADLLLGQMPNVAIARISLPVDSIPSPKNLIDKLSKYKQVLDVENSVTVVEDLASVLRQIIEKKATGIFHVLNPGALKYRDLMQMYREMVDPNYICEWITDQQLVERGLAAKQRSSVVLQSTRLAEFGIQMRPIDVALRDTMMKYAQAKRAQIAQTNVQPSSFHFAPQRPKEMKGIITAGGSGTRLAPLTNITNKHLLPIYNKPMVLYPLQTLLDAGVRKIILTTGPEHAHTFVKLLGSGSKYGCNITYRIQDQAGGIAQAIGLAEDFIGHDNCAVHLGDNIFEDNFLPQVSGFQAGATIFYKQVPDPRAYGVVEIDQNQRVLSIEEKPKEPKSNFAQLGLYIYDAEVFDIIRNLKPSARGELEISEVNSEFMRRGKLTARQVKGRWFDTGTFQDLKRATEYFAEREGIY